jgi:ribosomal protection tetracycline resistance protein
MISLGEPTSKIKILPAKSTTKFDLINALNIITEEDPFLEYELSEVNNDIYLNIFGEIQLEILAERMSTDFDVYVTFDKVQTIFKETPKKVGEHFIELYDKTYPFYAGIGCKIEPLCKKSGVEIVSEVSTGHLLKTFQNGILDGINKYIDQGLMGWPLINLKVTITEGKYDSVKSTPSDFRDLAPIVLMKALEKAETKLLWPILSFRIKVPEYAIGKVLAGLSSMQATFNKPIKQGLSYQINGEIPSHLCKNYELKLRSYTKGEGIFSARFSHYSAAPNNIEAKREKTKIDPCNVTTYLMAKRGIL